MKLRPTVSIVIVSHGRPDHLLRAVQGCKLLDYPSFELVVVADDSGCRAISRESTFCKCVAFNEMNISRARNKGIAHCAGEIVAFLDDDAVPETRWLDHVVGALEDPSVAAVTGPVRGRNGLSWQSFAPFIDRQGRTLDFCARPRNAVPKLVGTNMVFRRSVLTRLGGFDERYRFFLEDADLSLRLFEAGLHVEHVPLAEVHHAYASSARRGADRRPLDLEDIGRSLAVFLRTHSGLDDIEQCLAEHRATERRRILEAVVLGRCEPHDLSRLLEGFDRGARHSPDCEPVLEGFRSPPPAFLQMSRRLEGSTVLAARPSDRQWAFAEARRSVADGNVVTVFELALSTRYHRIVFDPEGFWVHRGGQFGRAIRTEPAFRLLGADKRIIAELDRLKDVRLPANDQTLPQIRWIPERQ